MLDESQGKMVRISVILPQDKRNLLGQIADTNGASVAWVFVMRLKSSWKTIEITRSLS